MDGGDRLLPEHDRLPLLLLVPMLSNFFFFIDDTGGISWRVSPWQVYSGWSMKARVVAYNLKIIF